MDRDDLNSILDGLAPSCALKPVRKHTAKPLILNELAPNGQAHMFVNKPHTDYNNLSARTLSERFMEGLHLLNCDSMMNVCHLAYWKPSSHKQGNPIENALDDNPETFWQSDGLQPHTLDIMFSKRMTISMIALYFSLISDESYTPRFVKIYVGNCPADALFYKTLDILDLNGWIALTFEDNREEDGLLKCQFIRLVFPVNHENGKDTHLRGIKIYAPCRKISAESADWIQLCESGNACLTECSLR
ncbi:hypothetical protein HG535_0G04950 [Zygotorulaspora mrakii]|uniref:DOC domain-containing protein n=1 Tax=Zygotorulaspora mrakii TaxID=42260 RepID=A0A7H9BA65_ZYGMR|nr:uncharacterized protein HG535_0G04950 [Zygotorulaspora mrakii]QLG74612.1 hypothetical protein HG535_0G04950 [Zygotorulaspora mrakii]